MRFRDSDRRPTGIVNTPFALQGKRALVTGGTRGIGAAVSRLLATCGASVCVAYRSRKADAEDMLAQLEALGARATTFAADVGSPGGSDALVAHALHAMGGLDICVHSAGIWPVEESAISAMDDERWSRTMRENLDGTFYVSRAAARAMLAGGSPGRIVLVSSTAGQRGEPMHADYAASKGAMISLVKSMAVELAAHQITVNAVAPGWVDTEMCEEPFAGEGRSRIARGIPVGRIATPEDIAFPIVCLCFEGARHVTGEVVNVNGGSVLCG